MVNRTTKQCERKDHHTFHPWGGGLYYCSGVELISPSEDQPDPKVWNINIDPIGQEVWDLFTLPRVTLTTRDGHTLEGQLKPKPGDDKTYDLVNYTFTCGEHDENGNHINAMPQ